MNDVSIKATFSVASLFTIIATFYATAQAAEVALADVVMTKTQQQSLGVTVSPVGKNTMLNSRRFPAEIVVPVSQVRVVSAPQSGLLDQLYVAAGQDVKKGQVIAHVSSPEILGLQKDYLLALTQKKLATKSLARDAELFKDGIIPQRRYLETESTHAEASASFEQSKQALRLAGMGEAAINKISPSAGMNSGISLTAPIEGQVLEQLVTTGQRVDMATPLYRIAKLNPLWLEIHAPLEGLPFVKIGMPVQIPKLQASGKLIAVIRNVNKADQTLHLRAEITQGTDKLSPGQMVEAEISLGAQAQHFSVPKSALARQGTEALVFVQTKTGFRPVTVKVISEQGDEAVVDAAFKGDEKIAVSGISAIKGTWLGLGGE
ncbi:MAG: efflux RND transporter periplasmic adaptor subunit [Methylotenera sp.]|uniref:efflux RND transporter periplasmic adaptor subunit n=1 Tax=Methylotenera sp. TaxID=2051956 RepID=UPI0017FB164D|nr:efflux RND transporter periplasmic adaptor subunit [Methylotenera sp.]NOU25300.1 efflux RND transporter periplasmic adaptor subunit [Methylotenera sp.]